MSRYIDAEWLLGVAKLSNGVVDIDDIYNAPTIDVVHGEWMPIIEENEFGEVYQTGIYCSECGEVLIYEANYCPNCGADMREREDE